MAKITIVIEDQKQNGRDMVKTTITPTAETLLKKIASHGPNSLTAAEAYAMAAVNRMRELSKSQESSIIIAVPRIGRR